MSREVEERLRYRINNLEESVESEKKYTKAELDRLRNNNVNCEDLDIEIDELRKELLERQNRINRALARELRSIVDSLVTHVHKETMNIQGTYGYTSVAKWLRRL